MATKKQPIRSDFTLDDVLAAGYRVRPAAPVEEVAPPVEERGALRGLADTGLELVSGGVKGVKFMSDVFGADNAVSSTLGDVNSYVKSLQSAQAKGEDQRMAAIMKDAEDKGIWEQVKAALSAAGEAPIRQSVGALATGLPVMAASMLPGMREAAWGTRLATMGGLGAAQGAGIVKSTIYDEVKKRAIAEGRSPEEAEALAQKAQAYDGENLDQIALGTGMGFGASVSGFQPAVVKALSGQAGRAGVRSMAGALATGIVKEVPFEAGQGGQEQMAGNLAQDRAGFATPTMRGVAGAMTLEGTLAAPGGAVGGALDYMAPQPPVVDDPAKRAADAIRQTEKVPETGTLTKAVNAGTEAKAQAVEQMGGRLTDTDMGSMLGGQGLTSSVDPVAGMIGQRRESEANVAANLAAAAEQRPPMLAGDAARILDEARSRNLDLTVAPHPDGGFLVVPRQWVTPEIAAQSEAELSETIGRMAQADAAPVERAPRTRSDGVELALPNDPVQNYLEGLRASNTPANQMFVRDFDAGRITETDVAARMEAEREKTADERLAAAAAQALPDDIMNPAGKPFKTLFSAQNQAKKTPGEIIKVEGGYTVRPTQGAADVSNTDAAGALASGLGGAVGVDAAGGRPDAGLLAPDAGQRTAGTAGAPAPDVQEDSAAPVSGQQLDPALTKGPINTKAKVKGLKNVIARRKAEAAPAAPAAAPDVEAAAEPAQAPAATPSPTTEPTNALQTSNAVETTQARQEKAADVPDQVGSTPDAIVPVKTVYGDTVNVRQSDLDGDRKTIPTFTKEGKRKIGSVVARDNLDPTGEKQAAQSAEDANSPMFDVITRKGGGFFATRMAAAVEQRKRGLTDSHEVVEASTLGATDKGFVVKRKQAEAPAAPAVAAPAPTQQAQAPAEPQEVTHNSTRIYRTRAKLGDEVKAMWAVETPENKARRAAGERALGGDTLHDTIEQAKAAADREAKEFTDRKAFAEKQDAEERTRKEADEARKAGNRGKSIAERRKETVLDGQTKLPASAGLGNTTRRNAMQMAVEQGRAVVERQVDDTAAKKRDQDAIDRVRSAGYMLGLSNENIPVVKAGLEAQARLKANDYKKPEYRVYAGSEPTGGFHEITKIEYEYAQELMAKKAAEPAAPAAAPTPQADEFLPDGWTQSVNGYTKRPVYRMEQDGGKPFAVVTQTEGMTYEVQIRHGDKQLTISTQRGALSEVLAGAKADLAKMTQAASVTHQDPGEKPEAATKGVVNDSLKTAAKNEDTKPSEMRKWLLAEIDKELLQAPDRADYDEAVKRLGEKDAISMYTGNGMLGKNTETVFITFDVPGDGKFKVRNSVRGLLEFRKTVNSSPGFKDNGQKTAKPEQNDGVQGGSGGQMAAIANMIEEGDFEAARDFAEAVGIKLEDVKVPRGERKPQWDQFLKDGTVPPPPNTAPMPEKKTAAQENAEKLEAEEAERRRPKDTGWNMAGTGYAGKRYTGRNITLADGREVVARIYESAGRYNEVEVKVDGVRKFTVTDEYNAQDKADAFIKTLTADQPKAAELPTDFIPAPDGGLDYGEITPEMGKAMRRQAGKIRLTRGVQNSNGTGHGLVHIEANHGKDIRALGFASIEEFVAYVAGGIQQVWQVPGNSQLLVTTKDGRKDVMYIRLEVAKEGDFYRVNSAFPVRQQDYEALHGMKKIWDGSEPTSAVTGQRPAFATAAIAAPDSESSQGSSNARGQGDSVAQPAPAPQAETLNPLEFTPKQYHEAKLRQMAERNGVPLAEVREMYDTDAGRAENEQEWVDAVVRAAGKGTALSRAAVDKLLEVRPDTRLPESALPQGYQRPEARKAEKEQKAKPAAPAKPIADFGEKIGGAKKDMWSGFKDDLTAVSDDDIASQPLSKVWPAPDYQALIDGGASPEVIAFVRSARDEVPAKPRVAYKVKAWANKVRTLRGMAVDLMAGKITMDDVRNQLERTGALSRSMQGFMGRVDLYQAVGHEKSLDGIRMAWHNYTIYKGQKDVSMWVVEKDAAASAFGNWPTELATGKTKEEAIEAFKKAYAKLDSDKEAKKGVQFDIISFRGQDGYWIAKKLGRNHVKVHGPLATVKEAREYRDQNQADLVAKLEKIKEIPDERRDVNEPRVGQDMRGGADVTPELFSDTFGFKGVEFGNWVEQGRRQQDLNNAFDALMDMAAVLGIPPRAISLNGQLGLAFGARGSGGSGMVAAAHYEPDKVVINLTKKNGAGSLGHEWWHAVDNYFAKMRKENGGSFMTTARDVLLASRDSGYMPYAGVRPEMVKAFGEVVKAINLTGMKKRASVLDGKRSKEYWTTGEEMSARSFESYLIAKLQDQNASNDYLANIVSEGAWNAAAALGLENENSYPYPVAKEVPGIRAAFDQFFQTVQTKQDDAGNVAMFSRAQAPAAGIPVQTAQQIVDAIAQRWDNAPQVVVLADMNDPRVPAAVRQRDAAQRSGGAKGDPEGFFYKGTAYVVAGSLKTPGDVVRVLLHESLGHYGLRGVFGDALTPILKQIAALRKTEVQAKADEYGLDMTNEAQRLQAAEEVLAVMAQTSPDLGYVKRAVAAVRAWLRKIMPKLFGQMKLTDADIIANYILPARRFVQSGPGGGPRGGLRTVVQTAAGKTWKFDRFADAGTAPGNIKQAMQDAMSLTGLDLGLKVELSNDLPAETPMAYDHETDTVLVNPEFAQMPRWQMAQWMAEEVLHALDSVRPGRMLSASAGAFDLDAGPVADEALSHFAEGGPLADWLAYPLAQPGMTKSVVKAELFARLGVIYFGQPELLRRTLPKAYEAYHETFRMGSFAGDGDADQSVSAQVHRASNSSRGAEAGSGYGQNPATQGSRAAGRGNRAADPGLERLYSDLRKNFGASRLGGIVQFQRSATAFSRSLPQALAAGVNNVRAFDVAGATGDTLKHYRGMALQALGRRQLVDLYQQELPQLATYNELVQSMDAEKNDTGAHADDLARVWGGLDSKTGKPGEERRLAELMHDATLAQIDPEKDYVDGDDRLRWAGLRSKFNALSPEAQTVYRQARTMYADHFAKVKEAIEDRIQRSEMSGSEKKAMMARMTDQFFAKTKGVYFPLARFGKYVVVARDAEGNVVSVNRAETLAEANTLRQELQKAFPKDDGFAVGKVLKDAEFNPARDAVGKGFLKELFDLMDKNGADDAMRDSVAQLYLASLPDLSWAKHGIHRKGTPGFSQDARRAFAQNMFHGARYLAKLRYSDRLQDQLDAMQDHIDAYRDVEEYDSVKAVQVLDEMHKRHQNLMNPQTNAVSTALTSTGFVFFLGLSPAAAVVNLSQTALVAYPIMGAKWGFAKSGAALLQASKETVAAKNDISKILKGDELAAYEQAVKDGTIDVTMAHDLAGISQGEDAKVAWALRPVMRVASFLFHHAERFNRQATFLAAFRLSKESGSDNAKAFEEAKKATYDGHFDYSASNRPRVMQGNVARVVLLFKQYGQNMVYTLSRQAYLSMKGLTPEDRKEARKQLGGILALHAAAAGALGLPLVGPLLAAASFIGGDEDEPWDAEVAMKNVMADAFGPKAAEVMSHGLSRLTPWDISSRVGLDRLILPDVREGLEGQKWAEAMMVAAIGPVGGIFTGAAKGLQSISEGRYARGLEEMLPVALRNPIKAIRYAEEGEVDKSGVVIKDEVSMAGILGQASGFAPSEVKQAQAGKSAIYQYDRARLERRQTLMATYAKARMAGDTEGMADVAKEISRFNEKNPTRRITSQSLMQSIRARQRRIQEADQGVYLPKNRRDATEAGRFAMVE